MSILDSDLFKDTFGQIESIHKKRMVDSAMSAAEWKNLLVECGDNGTLSVSQMRYADEDLDFYDIPTIKIEIAAAATGIIKQHSASEGEMILTEVERLNIEALSDQLKLAAEILDNAIKEWKQ